MAKDVRLQKMLADCGVASRRKAEEMIANGQVRVNGVIAKIGDPFGRLSDCPAICWMFADNQATFFGKSFESTIMINTSVGSILNSVLHSI